MQECLHFGVKRRAADDHLAELASESLNQLFADLRAYHFVEERHFEHPAYRRFLDLRNNHFLVYLLQNQRHRENDGRFDFCERFQQNFRAWCTSDEPCVASCRQTGKEVERTSVRMSQRKERHEAGALESNTALQSVAHIACQRIQRSDHTLAEARCAGSIVDRSDLFVAALVVVHVFCPVAVRVLLFEFLRDSVVVDLLRIQRQRNRVPVVQAHRSKHLRNLVQINSLPVDVADKQQFRTGMVDDMDGVVCAEVLQDRYDDSAIRNCSEIDGNPVAVVLSHNGDLVVFLHAAFRKQNMQFLNVYRQLAIRQRDIRSVVGHGGRLPVLTEGALIHLHKIVFFFGHHND